MWMKSHFHMKRWAPRLALRKRLKVIQKQPITRLSQFQWEPASQNQLRAQRCCYSVMLTWQWRCTCIFLFVAIFLHERWNASNFERPYMNLRTMACNPDLTKTVILNCTFSHQFVCLLWRCLNSPAEIWGLVMILPTGICRRVQFLFFIEWLFRLFVFCRSWGSTPWYRCS